MSLDSIKDTHRIIHRGRMAISIQNISLLLENLLTDFERLRWLFTVDLEHLFTSVGVISHLPLLCVFSEVFYKDHFLLVFYLSVLIHKLSMNLIFLKVRVRIQEKLSIRISLRKSYLGANIDIVHNLLIECSNFLLF